MFIWGLSDCWNVCTLMGIQSGWGSMNDSHFLLWTEAGTSSSSLKLSAWALPHTAEFLCPPYQRFWVKFSLTCLLLLAPLGLYLITLVLQQTAALDQICSFSPSLSGNQSWIPGRLFPTSPHLLVEHEGQDFWQVLVCNIVPHLLHIQAWLRNRNHAGLLHTKQHAEFSSWGQLEGRASLAPFHSCRLWPLPQFLPSPVRVLLSFDVLWIAFSKSSTLPQPERLVGKWLEKASCGCGILAMLLLEGASQQ